MDSKKRINEDKSYIMKIAEQESRPIINERKKALAKKGKILSFKEESRIRRKIYKKVRRKMALRGILAALGFSAVFGAGMKTQNLLNEVENKGITQTEEMITIDAMESGKDVNIKNDLGNINARKTFINGVQVGKDEIKQNIYREISQLETTQDVLTYLKNMFINENNYKHLKQSDIEIHKIQTYLKIYKDKAKNGDEIVRYKEDSAGYDKGVYIIEIKKEDGKEEQAIARDWKDKSVRLYNDKEEVEEFSENEMSKIGNIIMQGTDYAIAIGEEENAHVEEKDILGIYRRRFVNAIAEYREEKIEKIIKGTEYRPSCSNLIRQEQEIK